MAAIDDWSAGVPQRKWRGTEKEGVVGFQQVPCGCAKKFSVEVMEGTKAYFDCVERQEAAKQ